MVVRLVMSTPNLAEQLRYRYAETGDSDNIYYRLVMSTPNLEQSRYRKS
jgi:hypothetical protein